MSDVLEYLIETKSIEIKSEAPFFVWSSGIESPIYCDNRRLLSHPNARKEIVKEFVRRLSDIKTDAICGVATAGISWGTLIAHELNLPFIYVRNKAKDHGKKNSIEGDTRNIKNAVVIEDLISTGSSSLKACEELLINGISPILVASLFEYNLKKAKDNFHESNIPYISLSSIDKLIHSNLISDQQKQFLSDFNAN